MKKGILYITAILVVSILQSCGSKKQNLQFESPDKLTKVELKGDKANALDPWMLEIVISSGGKSGTLKTEFHTSEIDTNWVYKLPPNCLSRNFKKDSNFSFRIWKSYSSVELTMKRILEGF